MLGPFRLVEHAPSGEAELAADAALRLDARILSMEARAVRILEECGFLQPGPAPNGHKALRMPRAVRARLLPLAKLDDPDLLEWQHQAWGAKPFEDLSLDEQLETHFHAVQGGKLADALRTGRYYATDLRALAFRRSREERYLEAAELYRKIVEEFDPKDAHAWEYFGFNLALASGPEPLSEDRAAEIRDAYAKAVEYDRQNPLYHGRLLGFRARLGEDVRAEVQREMKRYLIKYGDQSKAVRYFVDSVRDGMSVSMFGSFYPVFRVLVTPPSEYRPEYRLPPLLVRGTG